MVAPILDGTNGRHRFAEPDDHLRRVALIDGEWVVERNQGRVAHCIGHALEMLDHHFRPMPHSEGAWREDKKCRRATTDGLTRDTGALLATLGINAVHDRNRSADLLHGDRHDALLLVERT